MPAVAKILYRHGRYNTSVTAARMGTPICKFNRVIRALMIISFQALVGHPRAKIAWCRRWITLQLRWEHSTTRLLTVRWVCSQTRILTRLVRSALECSIVITGIAQCFFQARCTRQTHRHHFRNLPPMPRVHLALMARVLLRSVAAATMTILSELSLSSRQKTYVPTCMSKIFLAVIQRSSWRRRLIAATRGAIGRLNLSRKRSRLLCRRALKSTNLKRQWVTRATFSSASSIRFLSSTFTSNIKIKCSNRITRRIKSRSFTGTTRRRSAMGTISQKRTVSSRVSSRRSSKSMTSRLPLTSSSDPSLAHTRTKQLSSLARSISFRKV